MSIQRLMFNLLILFIFVITLAGCNNQKGSGPTEISPPTKIPVATESSRPTETPGPIESEPSDPSTPITVKLILSKAPRLNEEADLTFIISSISDAPATNAAIILPEGTELINGDLEWSGALNANESHTMQAVIMFVSEGNKTIEAKALYDLGTGDIWGDAAYLYLNTTVESGQAGFSSEPTRISTGAEEEPPAITPSDP